MTYRALSRGNALRLMTTAALAAGAPVQAFAQAVPVIRAGVESNAETFAELLYGFDAGIFAKAGLDVQAQSFPSAGPIAAALAGGALDVGTVDTIVLANAVNRGLPLIGIAASGLFQRKEPTSALFVPIGSTIRNAKGFEGTTIAVGTLSSLTSASLRMWLAQNGVDPAKVQFAEMKFTEMEGVLQRGTVAGAYVVEPYITLNSSQLRQIAVPYSAIAESFPISVIVTTRAWVAQNADTAKRFVGSVYDTARWVNAHRGETAVMLAKYTKLDIDVVHRMHRTQFATTLEASKIQPVLDAAFANKLIDRQTNAADLISRVLA
jgi:NitT/TauT family transport system substrate-binding protein